MFKFSLNLPKYRLNIALAKRRGPLFTEPILPDIEDIQNIKKGHKISRFFRHVFEHKSIRRILGTNLAIAFIVSTFAPTGSLAAIATEDIVIEETNTPLTTKRNVRYPVEDFRVTQGFRFFHPGIDIDGLTGDKIYPIRDGVVEAISLSKFAYGNAVIINHGEGITSLYAHLSKIYVSSGQDVTTNTVLGEMGDTGRSSGDHLHLEIRDEGRAINPYSVLPKLR
jgi:murein DD-endopeptidase MepM/ murein hydrolase activator NlpD